MFGKVFAFTVGLLLAVASARASPPEWIAEGWSKTDFRNAKVPLEEILSGGPPKDGIPSIDNPGFAAAGADKDVAADEPVIGLDIAGDARAYPLRVLMWHEIVNDVVGATPVAVTYCPLCNAALVFDRRHDGRVLDFGTTGKLRHSDLVMYDRQTETWWQQFTGEAIVGALAGATLKMIPARLESFAEFKERHPGGKVLVPANPSARAYGRNPYAGYDSLKQPFLYKGDLPKDVPAMARVVAIRHDGKVAAVTLEHVRKEGRLQLGDIVLSWSKGQRSALDTARIAEGREVGTVTAERVLPDGRREPVVYDVTFAFVVHAFHPGIVIKAK